jgi:carbon monoxide dehydrogenase subunit G
VPLRCQSTVNVSRPPTEVFPWLLDADKVPAWMTGLEAYEPLDPGPLRVGSRIRQNLTVSGQHLHFVMEVARLQPPADALLRFEGSGFKAANEYSVTEAPGGSAVTWAISGDTTSFKAKLLAPMVEAKLQEKIDGDLARLRAVLDGSTA